MDLDKLIHERKHFAELEDGDVDTFLQKRTFHSEHLNIEFKSSFPSKQSGKYEIKKICKYIAGFSNEEGGLVIYGVADSIKDPATHYPDYVVGLTRHPTAEELSQWLRDRIHPLIASPAIRFFTVAGRSIAVLKIPPGVNKPYCYFEPDTRSLTFFKRTAGGMTELTPDEIREFYRTQIIQQSSLIVRAAGEPVLSPSAEVKQDWHSSDENSILAKLEDPDDYGLVEIHCRPVETIRVLVSDLKKFIEEYRSRFSESMSYFRDVEVFQKGVSVGYFPLAIRQDVKSTVRISLYEDGFTAFDSLADMFLRGDRQLNSRWLSYELQRHLQLTKAALKGTGTTRIDVRLEFEHIAAFRLAFMVEGLWLQDASYTGVHEPIIRRVDLAAIHDYDSPERNMAMPAVRDFMEEVGRIFGLSKAPPNLWDNEGILTYVKGLENRR